MSVKFTFKSNMQLDGYIYSKQALDKSCVSLHHILLKKPVAQADNMNLVSHL